MKFWSPVQNFKLHWRPGKRNIGPCRGYFQIFWRPRLLFMWESCTPLRTVHKFRVVIKVWSTQLYCWSKEGDRFWRFFLTNERTKKDTPDSSPAQNKKLNLWWFSPTARGKPQICTFIYWWCIYSLLQKYTWKYTVQPILNGHPPGNGSNIAPITSAILPK